ncbi:hypothetical protein VYU27_002276 [Nannochloropsis oceanica]
MAGDGRKRDSKEAVSFPQSKGGLAAHARHQHADPQLPTHSELSSTSFLIYGVGVGALFAYIKSIVKLQARPSSPPPSPLGAFADSTKGRRRRRRIRYEHEGWYDAQHHGRDELLLVSFCTITDTSTTRSRSSSCSSSSGGQEGPSWYLGRGISAPDRLT